jgi:hypothetical protein
VDITVTVITTNDAIMPDWQLRVKKYQSRAYMFNRRRYVFE